MASPSISSIKSQPKRYLVKRSASGSARGRPCNVVYMLEASTKEPVHTKMEVPLKNVGNGSVSKISSKEFRDLSRINLSKKELLLVSLWSEHLETLLRRYSQHCFRFIMKKIACLPEHFTIFGYARSKMIDAELRDMVSKTLTCRIDKRENCSDKTEQFLQ